MCTSPWFSFSSTRSTNQGASIPRICRYNSRSCILGLSHPEIVTHYKAGIPEKEEAAKLKVDGIVAIDSEVEIEHLHDLDAIADTVGGTTIQRLLKTIRKGGVLGSVLGQPEGADKYDIRVERSEERRVGKE